MIGTKKKTPCCRLNNYAVIVPACNEEACIRRVVDELRSALDPARFVIAVGVNGSSDATARIAREAGANVVAETAQRGYGRGCQAAIDAVRGNQNAGCIAGYLFVAADGANDPRDIAELVAQHEAGFALVLGCRTTLPGNRRFMSRQQIWANRLLGFWCGVLTGRFFADLGPLRLIDAALFERLQLCEWTYGWTIEAQVRAVRLGARVCEIAVSERSRIAGEQKVSGVSLKRTLSIGARIFAAGWRARRR